MDWSVGPNEPYWRTNTSFSLSPPPRRWNFQFQPDGLSSGSHDSMQLFGSSMSSNSRGSRSWLRENQISNHQYSTPDGAGPFFSSPFETSPNQQWTPPAIQEIKVDNYGFSSKKVLAPLSFSPSMEGTSAIQDSRNSISSLSDNSDYEPIHRANQSSNRNFPSRRYFMSKPIHPLSFPYHTPPIEAGISSFSSSSDLANTTPQRNMHPLCSDSGSIDFSEVSESIETDFSSCLDHLSVTARCGICERFLSQRSPWSSRRIVKSGDMPVAGVLSCWHVFHAECLDQITPKTRKNDPPCPLCVRSSAEQSEETCIYTKLKSSFPKLKSFSEERSSRSWGCAKSGDCVEGALHASPRMLPNRNQIRKNFGLQGKEFPGKLKKINSYEGAAGSSKNVTGPDMK